MLGNCTLRWALGLALLSVVGLCQISSAEIRSTDLDRQRSVSEGDWLRLKLEVLGLKLSYPAYRITMRLTEDNLIEFVFQASSGLASHLDEAGKTDAEKVLSYHAEGIRNQVDEMIKNDFPDWWSSYNARRDFIGIFFVPGDDWESPPQQLGHWNADRFYWN